MGHPTGSDAQWCRALPFLLGQGAASPKALRAKGLRTRRATLPMLGHEQPMKSPSEKGKAKYKARIDNIYFLSRIGQSLRWATQDIAREELPADIRQLLARLERQEAKAKAKDQHPEEGSTA
jgi:hypothetical protein